MENNIIYNEYEIVGALNVIKNICSFSEKCDTCPLFICEGKNTCCGVQSDPPHCWDIIELKEPKQFRAFEG